MKKILLLGGSNFVGRNIAEFLLKQPQYELTLFNRGISNPKLFAHIPTIHGDRNNKEDVKQIFQQQWDYIIDVSCYFPHQLKYVLSGDLSKLTNYIFISTCSVYDNEQFQQTGRNEQAPTLPCSDAQAIDTSPSSYGNRKAACERMLIKSGIPYTLFRPALIYGQYDHTDRMYYWLYQVKKGQAVILPEKGLRTFSVTYIQDLIEAIQRTLVVGIGNQIFNCTSTPAISLAEIIKICESVYGQTIDKVHASAAFLLEKEIPQWSGIPLWLNSDSYTYSNRKMKALLGIQPTPAEKGIAETISYYDQGNYEPPQFGISEAVKQQLIRELT